MNWPGARFKHIFFSTGPMARLEYCIGKLVLAFVASLTLYASKYDPSYTLVIGCLLATGIYAAFFSLRRLKDIGVTNINAGFMFLLGGYVASNGLANVKPVFGLVAGLLVLVFLLLAPGANDN